MLVITYIIFLCFLVYFIKNLNFKKEEVNFIFNLILNF